MPWFNSGQHPQKIHVPELHFLGEQDGVPERELKGCLTDLLRRDQRVQRAYLARVGYGEQSPAAVALCLRSQSGPDRGLAEIVAETFASMFGAHEHLDIIFVDEEQEAKVSKVCSPFFDCGKPKRSQTDNVSLKKGFKPFWPE